MTIFPYLHFFVFLVYSYLMVLVLWKNPKAVLNRVLAITLFCFAMWSFGNIFLHNTHVSQHTAYFSFKYLSLLPYTFSSFVLWFMLIFTKRDRLLRKYKFLHLFLFVIPAFLYTLVLTNIMPLMPPNKEAYGWGTTHIKSGWEDIHPLNFLTVILVSLVLVLIFWKKTKYSIEKKQARIIFFSTLTPLILGTMNYFVTQATNSLIPDISNVSALFFCGGLVYAIVKYKFLTVSPEMAAKNIVETLPESLFLINPKGEIASVNSTGLSLLGYEEKELLGQPVSKIFDSTLAGPEGLRLETFGKEGTVQDLQVVYHTKEAGEIPVAVSARAVKDKKGEFVYAVIIARDMRTILKLTEEKNQLEIEAATIEAREKEKRLLAEQYSKQLETEVEARTNELGEKVSELEEWKEITTGRELKMMELKKRVRELEKKYGEEPMVEDKVPEYAKKYLIK